MSALPPKADIGTQSRDVRFVPKADIANIRSLSSGAAIALPNGVQAMQFGSFQ